MTTIYLKIDRNMKIAGKDFCLKEIARVWCADKAVETKAGLMKIPASRITGPGRYVFSIMEVMDALHREFPSAEIQNLGEADFILTLEKTGASLPVWQWTKTLLVCVLTFAGAAFSIMAFHNDVGITNLFGQLYTLFTGRVSDGFTVLEISYSAGLGLGILIYFNHFGKKKITVDPTPLEVEMRAYEDEVNNTLIEANGREREK